MSFMRQHLPGASGPPSEHRCIRVRTAFALALALLCLIAPAAQSQVVISELSTSQGYVELLNRGNTSVSLAGMTLRAGGTMGSSQEVATLSGTLQAGQRYLLTGPGYSQSVSGDDPMLPPFQIQPDGSYALVGPSGTLDAVGFTAGSTYKEGTPIAGPSSLIWERYPGSASKTATDSGDNATDFRQRATPYPQNSNAADPVPIFTYDGAASPYWVAPGDTTKLTVKAYPGGSPMATAFTVTADLSSIGGSATQAFRDDGQGGDAAANDFKFTYVATVSGAEGAKSLPVSASDNEGRTAAVSQIKFMVSSDPAPAPQVVLSEFRSRGTNGAGDEFVELYNPTSVPTEIGGFVLRASTAAGATSNLYTIPAGTQIAAYGFYLLAGASYAGAYTADATWSGSLDDTGGVALFSGATVLDQAGMSVGSAYKEGTPLATFPAGATTQSYQRKNLINEAPQDTGNNASDFEYVTQAYPQSSLAQRPTKPGGIPVATSSPAYVNTQVRLVLDAVYGSNPQSTGVTANADLTSVGGASSVSFFNDGQHGDLNAGDSFFGLDVTVPATVAAGLKQIPVTVSDAQGRTTTGLMALTVSTATPPVVISEFYVGLERSVEWLNASASAVNVGGWKLKKWEPTGALVCGTVPAGTVLSAHQRLLISNDGTGDVPLTTCTLTYNDGIAIAGVDGSGLFDQLGVSSNTAYKEGSPYTAGLAGGESVNRRFGSASTVAQDTNDNAADYYAGEHYAQRMSSPLPVDMQVSAQFSTATVAAGTTTKLTATMTPGASPPSSSYAATANLSSIGGSAVATLYDDGTHGDVTSQDKTFSLNVTPSAASGTGAKTVPLRVVDDWQRQVNRDVSLTVTYDGPTGAGSAIPSSVRQGTQTRLDVAVTPGHDPASSGITVTADLSSLGGSSTQALTDTLPVDGVYSASATVPVGTSPGAPAIPFTVSDAQGRQFTGGSVSFQVVAGPPKVVISEVEPNSTSANEWIEFLNVDAGPAVIGGWRVLTSTDGGTAGEFTRIRDGVTLAPGQRYLLANAVAAQGGVPSDQTYSQAHLNEDTIFDFGGVGIKTADGGTYVDQVGWGTGSALKEGSPAYLTFSADATRSLNRRPGSGSSTAVDTDSNSADFVLAKPYAQTSSSPAPTDMALSSISASPATVPAGSKTKLTVHVTPGTAPLSTGIRVQVDQSSPFVEFFDTGVNGDAAAGDGTYTAIYTVPSDAAGGPRQIPVIVFDDYNRVEHVGIPITVGVAPSPNGVLISEVRPSGSASFVELLNTSASSVDISGYTLRMTHRPDPGEVILATIPPGTLMAPGSRYLLAGVSYADATPADLTMGDLRSTFGIGLLMPDGVTIVDAFANDAPGTTGYGEGTRYNGTGSTTAGYVRLPGSAFTTAVDTQDNLADFTYVGQPYAQNSNSPFPTSPSGSGASAPASAMPGTSVLLTVDVTPGQFPTSTGIEVSADLTAIGGASSQGLFDTGINGDQQAGDGTFGFQATLPAGTALGQKVLPFTIVDSDGRTGAGQIVLTVGSPPPAPTATATATPTPSLSPTPTPVLSPTPTPVLSPTPTPVLSPTPTPVLSPTPTPFASLTPSPMLPPSPTATVGPASRATVALPARAPVKVSRKRNKWRFAFSGRLTVRPIVACSGAIRVKITGRKKVKLAGGALPLAPNCSFAKTLTATQVNGLVKVSITLTIDPSSLVDGAVRAYGVRVPRS